MAGLGIRTAEAGGSNVTPDREVEVHFDVDENVLLAPPFSRRAYGEQIVHDTELVPDATATELLASGYWIMRPLQGRLDKIHETTEMGSATMLLSEFNHKDAVKQEPLYRTAVEIPGLTTGAGPTLATSANDLFFGLRRSALDSWTDAADEILGGVSTHPDLPSVNIAMDRVMVGSVAHDPDQGYLLRFQCTGTHRHAPDNIFIFYFGGPLFAEGYGQYCLVFHGDGTCTLYEYHHGDWARRLDWRYCAIHQVMDAAHTMRILPHMFRYIEFRSETNERAEPSVLGTQAWGIGPYASPRESPSVQLYTTNPSLTGQPGPSPNGWVTGQGYVAVDVRRDLRPAWQISRLQYPAIATLSDRRFGIPYFVDENALLKVSTDYFQRARLRPEDPADTLADIETVPIDAVTGLPLAGDATTGYSLPVDNNVAVQFNFTSLDTYLTPFLRGYTAQLVGTIGLKSIGEKTGGAVMDYQISGPTSDPTHETASLTIEDAANELEPLRNRSGQTARIRTTYDPDDTSKKSILFHGRITRAEGKLWGYDRGQEYPDPEWRTLSLTLLGEWQRLHEQLMVGQFDFSQDDTADPSEFVNGARPSWKISRIVEHLISYSGYQTTQIDVAELEILGTRIPTEAEAGNAYRPLPFTSVGDYIQRILRDFLGAYLIWDANAENGAGFPGMWRVLFGPTIDDDEDPLWEFTNGEPPAPSSGVTLLGRTEAYPDGTTFIQRGSFISYPQPPEANAIMVVTTGDLTPDRAQLGLLSCAINYHSYNPPGGPGLDDPDDPDNVDYLGRFVPLVFSDPLLAAGNTPEERQAALDLFTRRIFNIACRGYRILEWESPLVLVDDPGDLLLAVKRPLRYGDFVRVDGVDCIIRSANPSFQKDFHMMCAYSAEVYRAPE